MTQFESEFMGDSEKLVEEPVSELGLYSSGSRLMGDPCWSSERKLKETCYSDVDQGTMMTQEPLPCSSVGAYGTFRFGG